MKSTLFLALMCVAFSLSAQNPAIEWRNDRTGIYNETGLLKSWPEKGPELLWHFDGLGDGWTAVTISNGKIYATGLDQEKLNLFVFDLNGKLLTKKHIGTELTGNRYHGARSQVNISDGKLYLYTALGELFCLDENTLDVVWKKDLFKEFEGKQVMWGVTESPLIVGDKVFITPGGTTHNIVALNKNTGATIWTSKSTGTPSSYCSPLFIGDQSVPILVTWIGAASMAGRGTPNENKLVGLNANTGELLWSQVLPSENTINPNTPIYSNGKIFVTTGYRGGSWLLNLKNGGRSVEMAWKNNADNQMGGAVKVGNYVYTTGHQNRAFFCTDWTTGEIKYREASISGSATIYADGLLYVYSDRGTMNLIKPNPEKFELVSSFPITLGTEQHWAHPVIYKGVLYVRHGNTLMAYNIKN
jgi:outer membrane protein assembly factor BamB